MIACKEVYISQKNLILKLFCRETYHIYIYIYVFMMHLLYYTTIVKF